MGASQANTGSVMALPSADRNAFIQKAVGDQESLHQEIKSLLAYKSMTTDFLESPTTEVIDPTALAGSYLIPVGRQCLVDHKWV